MKALRSKISRRQLLMSKDGEIGSRYSEDLDKRRHKHSGKARLWQGQFVQVINLTDLDFIELIFTIPKLFCRASEGLARGQAVFCSN